MEVNEKFKELLCSVKEKKPLVHHITNYVTVNDCANIVLAVGGSPVMADDINEVEDMVSIASSLVINIGTLNSRTIEAMVKAGKRANKLGIPVVLDPVGVGATPYRKETALRLIKEIKFAVIRGNLAEIKILCGMNAASKGVDSEETLTDDAKEVAKVCAKNLNTVVAITGVNDYVSDGNKVMVLKNGTKMLTTVTGTGCMTTSLVGTYCGVTKDYLLAAAAGILTMSMSGEKAYEKLTEAEGSGNFRVRLIDEVFKLKGEDFMRRGSINEVC
ncbi:hydroxyethylthiazole kinase [Clostridium neuense]|uniref:Hydroxyethylthiazole kinase n=1 Tax=Clostridium neuense TaxID=1728934 RepID=A0ABW8TFP8_9CLOT